jgi:hypothetical protein
MQWGAAVGAGSEALVLNRHGRYDLPGHCLPRR